MKPLILKVILISVVFLITVWIVFKVSVKTRAGILESMKSLEERLPSSYSLSKEDSSLFKRSSWNKLKVIETYRTKLSNPISLLSFDKYYHIITAKVKLDSIAIPVDSLIHLHNKTSHITPGYGYFLIPLHYYAFNFKAGPSRSARLIDLNLDGDSLLVILAGANYKNYFLKCRSFGVAYSQSDVLDFVLERGDVPIFYPGKIRLSILLLRRGQDIYIFLMAPDNPERIFPEKLLSQLLILD
jgi:hypothetical protein